MEFPSREDLIDYAIQQAPLRHTTTKRHYECLHFLVDSYLSFVKEGDLPEYHRRFWVSDLQMTRFPEEDFKSSLSIFFSSEDLWNHSYIRSMRHEHLRILFFIAALRYRRLQEPQQQIKFQEENPSEGGIIDLFLFDKNQSSPAYALQVRLLTPYDLDSEGSILETRRTKEFLKQGIDTFDEYTQDSQIILTSSLYAIGYQPSQEAKTHGCVVLVTPYDFVWINCGRYAENLTSKLHDENSSRRQRGFYEKKKKYLKPKTMSPKLQYSQIPSQNFNSFPGINTSQPMYNPNQQNSQSNLMQYNGGFIPQTFAQYPFLQQQSHGMSFPHPGYVPIPTMFVMPDPNFLPFYNNSDNYQGFPQQQQMSAGVRMNPINGWKERGFY